MCAGEGAVTVRHSEALPSPGPEPTLSGAGGATGRLRPRRRRAVPCRPPGVAPDCGMVSAPVVVGSGPTKVLALHGWFGSASGWGPFAELVHEDRYSYLFLDHRGYGARRGETGEFTLAEMSRDALAAVDSLDWSTFAVLGHSMGGSVMQRVLLDAGDRVTGLVGVSPVPSTGVPFDEQGAQLFGGAAANRENRYAIID